MRIALNSFVTIVLLTSIGCGQSGSGNADKDSPPKPLITTKSVRPANAVKAPDFTLQAVGNGIVSLHDLLGKVVLLNFWGTWCGPCRKEIPDLNKLHEKYYDDGLRVVGITLSSGSAEDIAKFMKTWKMNYIVLTDIEGNETMDVTVRYGKAVGQPINGIPTTFIIDREGYIVKGYLGPRNEEIFYNDLRPYLE